MVDRMIMPSQNTRDMQVEVRLERLKHSSFDIVSCPHTRFSSAGLPLHGANCGGYTVRRAPISSLCCEIQEIELILTIRRGEIAIWAEVYAGVSVTADWHLDECGRMGDA